jgi:GH25 family lysozyme M1 (1,4-beta-N-acetylmuramidase)
MFEPIIDVSTWQRDIDVSKMLGQGTKGMYIKAGGTDKNNGASYTDLRFRENAEKFTEKIPCGFYYFFYPHFDGAKQATYFANLLRSVNWNLPPAIDVESNPRNVNQAKFQKEIKAFADVVETKLNVKCVIYTRGMFWNFHVGNPSWAADHKLWIALYHETADHPWGNDSNSKLRPKPWNDYWLWQYSADKNGKGAEFGVATAGIDINRVNMDEDDFYAFAGWDPTEVPPVVIEPEEGEEEAETVEQPENVVNGVTITYPHKGFLRVGFTVLRLRSTPTSSRNDNIIGVIRSGFTFTVHKELQTGDDLWWLVELPNHQVGWSARRLQGITFLEYAD